MKIVGIAVLLVMIGGKVFPAPDDKETPTKKGLGTFTIDKKTTYVTGPVDADGQIDYVAALNERLSKGVTTENNAAVLLWQVIGPHPERATMPAKFYELLGVQIPEQGDYFLTLQQFLEKDGQANEDTINAFGKKISPLYQRAWTAKEHPEIYDWLKANEKPLALLVEATKRTHYYSPLLPHRDKNGLRGLTNAYVPWAQVSRHIAAALALRATLKIGEGHVDAAWQDLLTCHRLGRLIGRGATMIECLVGIAIERIACSGDLVFLDKAQPDAKRIEACLRNLRALPIPAAPAEQMDVGERFIMLDIIMMTDKQGYGFLAIAGEGSRRPDPLGEAVFKGINWDITLETVNKWHDRMVAAMREKDRFERKRKLNELIEDRESVKANAINPDRVSKLLRDSKDPAKLKGQVIADILIGGLLSPAWIVQDGTDKVAQTFDNVVVAFALVLVSTRQWEISR